MLIKHMAFAMEKRFMVNVELTISLGSIIVDLLCARANNRTSKIRLPSQV
jgi:hypothetical protein